MVDKKNVFLYAGAFIAFLIGSGFATGQEVMQYFVAYGYAGIAAVAVVFVLFLYVGVDFITVGYEQRFERPNDIFAYYCGRYLGKFYDYFSVVFIYMSFFVMVAGAGASLNEQFGLPTYVGGAVLGVLATVTVLFGLNRIVDIIGKIGPAIVIMSIVLGVVSIARNPQGLLSAPARIAELNLLRASSNWLFSAGSYVGFCMLWLAAFLSSLGKGANSKREAGLGAICGAVGFSLAVLVVALGLMANLDTVAGSMIPMLVLARQIHPSVALAVTAMVILGIYTTSVPLLWTACAKAAREKTAKFRVVTVVLGGLGIVIGLMIPFDRLVNIVYVINGYVGIVLLFLMALKSARKGLAGRNPCPAKEPNAPARAEEQK